MPYIKEFNRDVIDENPVGLFTPANAGELQYVIAEFMHRYILNKGLCYQTCNDMMGALTGAQAEFYRKVVAPYEDIKIQENGPVYFKTSKEYLGE